MFWLNAIIARQRELKHVSMDTLDSPTVLDGHGNKEWDSTTIGWMVLSIEADRCYKVKTLPEIKDPILSSERAPHTKTPQRL
jgi:hypothetical protein